MLLGFFCGLITFVCASDEAPVRASDVKVIDCAMLNTICSSAQHLRVGPLVFSRTDHRSYTEFCFDEQMVMFTDVGQGYIFKNVPSDVNCITVVRPLRWDDEILLVQLSNKFIFPLTQNWESICLDHLAPMAIGSTSGTLLQHWKNPDFKKLAEVD